MKDLRRRAHAGAAVPFYVLLFLACAGMIATIYELLQRPTDFRQVKGGLIYVLIAATAALVLYLMRLMLRRWR
jgi:hypothetical protein